LNPLESTLHRRSALVITVAALMTGCDKLGDLLKPVPSVKPLSFHSTDITGSPFGQALVLQDGQGKTRTLADFKGKVVVVFFGFTRCPDVCPTGLAEIAALKKALGPKGDQLQGVFISVDPERDSADVLQRYVTGFDPSFVGLRGTPEQTAAAAKDFRIFYAKVPGKTPDSYTMDHTAGSYVFDATGQVRLFVRNGVPRNEVLEDITQLMPAGA